MTGRLRVRHLVWAVLITAIAGAPFIPYFLFPDDWMPTFFAWIQVQRLNPLVPPNFQNYFFGATNIAPLPYSIATFFGIMPLTAVYVYLGVVGQSLVFEEGLTPSKIALLCLGLIASAAVVYVMTKKV